MRGAEGRGAGRRRGPWRPRLPAERRRQFRLEVMFSKDEAAALRVRAAGSRRSCAAFVREAALRKGPPAPVPLLNVRSAGQLGRLANNLNQLVKLCHQGRAPVGLLTTLRELLAELNFLRRLLLGLASLRDERGER